MEPSGGIDRIVEGCIDVTGEALRTPKVELTLLPGATHGAARVHGAGTETPDAGRPTDVVTISLAVLGSVPRTWHLGTR